MNEIFKLTVYTFFVAIFLVLPSVTQAAVIPDDPANFITTWNTENPGSSADNQITIPGTESGYSYEIYWEDTASSTINGTTTLITTNSYTLTFPAPGIYEVQASGTFPRIYFNNSGDREKILTVEQWGDIAWTNMGRAFQGASNLRIPATDAPDLSGVINLERMFFGATAFNDPIEHWDVSNVQIFSQMFREAAAFNQPLNNWTTTSAVDFFQLFQNASAFNQPLDQWEVGEVTTLNGMFGSTPFNHPLNEWNVSKVTNMRCMFCAASAFNQPLDQWNTASATTMAWMFYGRFDVLNTFNQDISMWDTSNVADMDLMFRNSNFDRNIASWNIENVTSAQNMFRDTILSTQNQDATLDAWSKQAVQPNVPFHLGLKNYSDTGAAALQTLKNTYNWTITEQYKAQYTAGTKASLIGDGFQAPINSGDSTTGVEVRADGRCTFLQWSDGNTDNPRTDTLTDNLTVEVELNCPTQSTSAATQAERKGITLPATEHPSSTPHTSEKNNTPTSANTQAITVLTDKVIEGVKNFSSTIADENSSEARQLKEVLIALIATMSELVAG